MKFYFINLISKEKNYERLYARDADWAVKGKIKADWGNDVVFNNGMNDIRLTMNANGRIFSAIADDPDDFPTVRQVDFPEIFEIIKQLKKQESSFKGSSEIKSEWNRIVAFVRMNMSLNLEND